MLIRLQLSFKSEQLSHDIVVDVVNIFADDDNDDRPTNKTTQTFTYLARRHCVKWGEGKGGISNCRFASESSSWLTAERDFDDDGGRDNCCFRKYDDYCDDDGLCLLRHRIENAKHESKAVLLCSYWKQSARARYNQLNTDVCAYIDVCGCV